jgi:hypothetical protein
VVDNCGQRLAIFEWYNRLGCNPLQWRKVQLLVLVTSDQKPDIVVAETTVTVKEKDRSVGWIHLLEGRSFWRVVNVKLCAILANVINWLESLRQMQLSRECI